MVNDYQPGCLEITKTLQIPGGVPVDPLDGTFIINVAGPGGFSQNVTFTMVDGAITSTNPQTLNDLIPGNYTLTEPGIPTTPVGWSNFSGLGIVEVTSGESCATRTVVNKFTPGCLEVTKVVDLDEYPFASSANATFEITVTGPSYPLGHNLTFHLINGEVEYACTGNATACLCDLIPGNYTVAETPPAGWNLTGITPAQPVAVEPGTACNGTAVVVNVTNRLLIPHTTMLEITYVYDSASGNVTMNITDCNDGEVPLTDVVVYLRANNVTYPFSPMGRNSTYFQGGDDSPDNDILDPGECWTWVVNVTINGTTFFEAWGDGIDPLGNHVTYNPDTGEGYESEYRTFEIVSCWGDETAWAYGGVEYADENWDHADSNNWGWTNGPLSEGSYEWDLYAGAGQNILSKGTVVGTVSVNYTGDCVYVTYSVDEGYYLGETHLWVGNDWLPEVTRGRRTVYTDAPGQFPHGVDYGFDAADPGTWETEWSWSGCGFSGQIYVAAHGVVWMEVECEENTYSMTTESDYQPDLWSAFRRTHRVRIW